MAAITEEIGHAPVWEPFCGGLSVTVELAKTRRVIATDNHGALIALYRACQRGWTPPALVTREEYAAAKALPDHDPLKAFIGFGCSYAGKWFGGKFPETHKTSTRMSRDSLVRQFECLAGVKFGRVDFLKVEPRKLQERRALYCDPPYEGTTGYGGAFDHCLFWARAQQWARCGVRVFVSEFQCPVPHRVLWERERKIAVTHGHGRVRVDRLYEVRV